MTPGALLLKARQSLEGGLSAAYFRNRVRPRIVVRPPMAVDSSSFVEIHALTSAKDWLNLCWGLASFFHFSGNHFQLTIHGDGSLDESNLASLRQLFPEGRILQGGEVEATVGIALQDYPNVGHFRQQSALAKKVVDFFILARSQRVLVFDSDLLFFDKPEALLTKFGEVGTNYFNADVESAYVITPQSAKQRFGIDLQPRINSGLAVVDRQSISLPWLEEFLSDADVRSGHFWRIEQTLFALCSSRYGVELLPNEYTLHLERGIGERPFRHYVGAIRQFFYSEGIKRLAPLIL